MPASHPYSNGNGEQIAELSEPDVERPLEGHEQGADDAAHDAREDERGDEAGSESCQKIYCQGAPPFLLLHLHQIRNDSIYRQLGRDNISNANLV